MNFVDFAVDERLVSDTERAAFGMYADMVAATGQTERAGRAVGFADILGNPGEFTQYVKGGSGERLAHIDRLLKNFLQNSELLVHKTWVEKSDEKRKEKLLDEILAFEREFRDGHVVPAFRRFVALARSIAHLLFGAQSRADDFLLYCFRIDPKLGLFFWYVGELESGLRDDPAERANEELLTVEILVGMYVLSCF